MRTLLSLVRKDFKRDFKRPWSILLFASLPVIMTGIIALVFGGRRDSVSVPTIHVAILDQDKDLLPHMLRYLVAQEDAAEKLQLHFVENRNEGLHLLEKRKVSAFVVLPDNMTERLLKGQVNAIELYENPSERYLPKVVRHGVSLLAVGLSSVAEVLQAESQSKPQADSSHNRLELLQASLRFLQTLRHSLIELETVPPTEYKLQATNSPKDSPPS